MVFLYVSCHSLCVTRALRKCHMGYSSFSQSALLAQPCFTPEKYSTRGSQYKSLVHTFASRHHYPLPPCQKSIAVFAEFSFTCIIDLTSALEYDSFISGFMEFYQKTGEPYLGTPYAIMMCYWDGIVHFIIYLMLVHRISNRKQYRTLGLFWSGSLCANMIVFVPGIVAGKYGSEIRPAFWLNMPFLLVPIWGAVTLFSRPRDVPLMVTYKAEREQKKALIWRPVDLFFVIYVVAAMGFSLFRGLAVLDCPLEILDRYVIEYEPYLKDPVGFPKVMMLLMLFHALPMLGCFAYGCAHLDDGLDSASGLISEHLCTHVLRKRTEFLPRPCRPSSS